MSRAESSPEAPDSPAHAPHVQVGKGAVQVRTASAARTRHVAIALSSVLRAGDLIVLDGPLGAGKTTFTQGLGEGLGVRGPVASPTFVIQRVHPSLCGGPQLVHVDAYRLGSVVEIEDLDLEADLDQAVTVIEWGRGRVEHLRDSWLRIELDREIALDTAPEPEESGAHGAPEREKCAEPDGQYEPDDLNEPDDLDEPRALRLVPDGPRWDERAISELRAALSAAEVHNQWVNLEAHDDSGH